MPDFLGSRRDKILRAKGATFVSIGPEWSPQSQIHLTKYLRVILFSLTFGCYSYATRTVQMTPGLAYAAKRRITQLSMMIILPIIPVSLMSRKVTNHLLTLLVALTRQYVAARRQQPDRGHHATSSPTLATVTLGNVRFIPLT